MSSITITVPMDYYALTRASDMLHGMALDVDKQLPYSSLKESLTETAPATQDAAPIDPVATDQEEKDAASVFGSQPGKTETAPTATAPEPAPPAETTPPPAAIVEAPAPAPSAMEAAATTTSAPTGVDLDSDGLPWDSRIHAGSKGKLAKTGQWKKKRGVDPALVEKVEAELHAAMAAGPANPVEAAAPTPAPAVEAHSAPAAPAPAPAPAPPVEEAKPSATGAITTFPALMQKITAAGVSQSDVTAAVNKQGLPALPLLAARPDLIPAVAAELFGG